MQAVILVGGLGTRLSSVVADRPKSIADVADRPFLEILLEQLRSGGFTDVVLCVGHLADKITELFGDGGRHGLRIRYSREGTPLGTAGAVKHAEPLLADTFLVMNGDSFCDADLGELYQAHVTSTRATPRQLTTLLIARVDDVSRYGSIETDPLDSIVAFREKAESRSGPGWINAGIYVFEKALLQHIPSGQEVSVERETFPLLLDQQLTLRAHRTTGFFIDIGTPESYAQAQECLRRTRP